MKELILGGVRSGKSALAQSRAEATDLEVLYLATATVGDDEMVQRVTHHRESRPGHWQLLEEPVALADALRKNAAPERCILVDCLTLWLSNLLDETQPEPSFERQIAALLQTLPSLPGHTILVSNEVGMGIVPTNPLARRFRDEAGRLHQALAEQCERVTLVVAGLPLALKGAPF